MSSETWQVTSFFHNWQKQKNICFVLEIKYHVKKTAFINRVTHQTNKQTKSWNLLQIKLYKKLDFLKVIQIINYLVKYQRASRFFQSWCLQNKTGCFSGNMNWSDTSYLSRDDWLYHLKQDVRKSQRSPWNPCCIVQGQPTKHQASPQRLLRTRQPAALCPSAAQAETCTGVLRAILAPLVWLSTTFLMFSQYSVGFTQYNLSGLI